MPAVAPAQLIIVLINLLVLIAVPVGIVLFAVLVYRRLRGIEQTLEEIREQLGRH